MENMAGKTRTLPAMNGRLLWLACGVVLLGLIWPEVISYVGKLIPFVGNSSYIKSRSGAVNDDVRTSVEDPRPADTRWKLTDDSGGFRTFTSAVPGGGALALRGETVVNEHIGRLYTAFLNTTSTLDWVRFLDVVEELPAVAVHGRDAGKRGPAGLHGEGDGQVIFQKYDMPWPVKDREVLLHRTVRLDKRAKRMTATYKSTDHPARPVTDAAIRAIVHGTSWILTSVGAKKTSIEFETRTDPRGSLPMAIVSFMQRKFPRDTVGGFVDSAKGVEIHPAMAKW